MSEIRTSLDFREFSYVPFPDSSDFGQCLKSKQKCLDFGHFFLSEIQTLKIQMGQKFWISDRKKVSQIRRFEFGFRILFYLHTSDNLLPFPYSVK